MGDLIRVGRQRRALQQYDLTHGEDKPARTGSPKGTYVAESSMAGSLPPCTEPRLADGQSAAETGMLGRGLRAWGRTIEL